MAGKGTFLALYRKLNPEQKKAVDAIEGPVMVVAGPGTGKTQILTLRIANILRKTDASPDSILALTFTESGVFSMRKRLVEIIGSAAYRVHIHTFHGFCNDVIRRFPDEFPRIIGSRDISDVDKITLLKEIVLACDLVRLKPFGDNFYYLNDIRSKISELKRENITPTDLVELVRREEKAFTTIDDLYYTEGKWKGMMRGKYRDLEKKLEKDRDLSTLYKRYQEALAEHKYYDYEDMIMETVRTQESNRDLLLSLQEEYQYILADEHQDANTSQNRLLLLLTSFHENPNLFIVGDEKQAIFRFQGASLENFRFFEKRYPDALLVTLRENYRSRQHILDAAHSLVPAPAALRSSVPQERVMRADAAGAGIEIRAFSKPDYEYEFLVDDIKRRVDEGVPHQEIAVLYRTNRDADPIIRHFEKAAVPFVVESDQNILADSDIRKFITLLRAVVDFGRDGMLIAALHADFLDIDPADIYRIVRHADKRRMPPFAVFSSKTELTKAGIRKAEELHRWYGVFRSWKKAAENKSLLDVLEIIMHESGFMTHILARPDADATIEKANALFDDLAALVEVHRDYSLADYLSYLDLCAEYNIVLSNTARTSIPDRVRLMTAHKAKGLEFDYVYLVGVRDGHWGRRRRVAHFTVPFGAAGDDTDDERRLFYVALTRAREQVFLSYAKESAGGSREMPSQFVEEIDPKLIEEIDMSAFESSVTIDTLRAPKKELTASRLADRMFLNTVFLEQGLSVTALNNYLVCPWRYFYSNLIRIPKAPSKYMLFGTAAHRALKRYYDTLPARGPAGRQAGSRHDATMLIALLERELENQPLSENELLEMREKGKRAFLKYRPYLPREGERVLSEYKIETHLPTDLTDASSLLLRGVLDRLDIAPNGRDVIVTDYKTGKPKSRNAIEGKTKSADGSYKRQLVFYKLLLDLLEKWKYGMIKGVIDFVEPDERKKYHRESFVIEDDEVAELKETIHTTAKEILDLAFWDRRCDDTKCDYCALRDLMR